MRGCFGYAAAEVTSKVRALDALDEVRLMRPDFDERDAAILRKREESFNRVDGPRVGDFLRTPDGVLRFTHDWGDSIQTTVRAKHPCYGDASFYLSDGYASFSGSLDPAIDKSLLRDTGETMPGSFWFFHHDVAGAGRGVYCTMPCRLFECQDSASKDDSHEGPIR